MDDARFDTLSRLMGDGPTRRHVTRILAGVALGGSFAWDSSTGTVARKKHKKKKKKKSCKSGTTKCGNRCISASSCCTTADCAGGQRCLANGACATSCDDAHPCAAGCECSIPNTDGASACIAGGLTCQQIPQSCASSDQCPLTYQCQPTNCGPGASSVNRCVPLCLS